MDIRFGIVAVERRERERSGADAGSVATPRHATKAAGAGSGAGGLNWPDLNNISTGAAQAPADRRTALSTARSAAEGIIMS